MPVFRVPIIIFIILIVNVWLSIINLLSQPLTFLMIIPILLLIASIGLTYAQIWSVYLYSTVAAVNIFLGILLIIHQPIRLSSGEENYIFYLKLFALAKTYFFFVTLFILKNYYKTISKKA